VCVPLKILQALPKQTLSIGIPGVPKVLLAQVAETLKTGCLGLGSRFSGLVVVWGILDHTAATPQTQTFVPEETSDARKERLGLPGLLSDSMCANH
jgi:hypothetical protein